MFADVLLPLVRLYLALVLVVAGTAKLIRPGPFQETLASIGMPRSLRAPVGAMVIGIEGLVAIGLWVPGVTQWAAIVGAILFGGFATLGALFNDRQIRCNCFGGLTDDTLSWSTVIRNVPLLAGAVLLAIHAAEIGPLALVDLPVFLATAVGLILLEPIGRFAWSGRGF